MTRADRTAGPVHPRIRPDSADDRAPDRHDETPADSGTAAPRRDTLGAWGERTAVAYLVAQGMVLLDRNWRTRTGEVDAILRDGDAVVFCEVKTRRTDTFGTPAEAVVPAKVRRLRRLAAQWLDTARVRPHAVRFDVVAVTPRRYGPPLVEHTRGAF